LSATVAGLRLDRPRHGLDPERRRRATVTTIRAAFLARYPDLARDVGLDPMRMLDEAGVPRAALNDPDFRIPAAAARALLENSARATEDFGLRLAERLTVSEMGPLNLVVRDQPTVREILHTAIRYTALQDEAVRIELEEAGDVAILGLDDRDLPALAVRQSVEFRISQLMRVLRRHLCPHWRPISVSFVYPAPRSRETHHRMLGTNLEFDRDFNGVVFDRADLDRRNPMADPEMARQMERFADSLMPSPPAGLPSRARQAVLESLRTGRCSVEDTAERLGLEVRTLQRQLSEAGTGFLGILQQVRMELADQLVPQTERPLSAVAERLGFSAASAFSRWHHAHYRCSPSARRAATRR
jgi:AraC-like DNA-binding protein